MSPNLTDAKSCITCGASVPADVTTCPVCNSRIPGEDARALGVDTSRKVEWKARSASRTPTARTLLAMFAVVVVMIGVAELLEAAAPYWTSLIPYVLGAVGVFVLYRRDQKRD